MYEGLKRRGGIAVNSIDNGVLKMEDQLENKSITWKKTYKKQNLPFPYKDIFITISLQIDIDNEDNLSLGLPTQVNLRLINFPIR